MKRFEVYLKVPKQTNWYFWCRYKTYKGAMNACKHMRSLKIDTSMAKIIDREDNNASFINI